MAWHLIARDAAGDPNNPADTHLYEVKDNGTGPEATELATKGSFAQHKLIIPAETEGGAPANWNVPAFHGLVSRERTWLNPDTAREWEPFT